MKLSRKLILTLALILSVAMATTGTLAYLTDRDSDANIFTVGNVDIKLDETYETGSELLPGKTIKKIVTISNVGRNDAYVWATVAVPAKLASVLQIAKNVTAWNWKNETGSTTIDGVDYTVYTALYKGDEEGKGISTPNEQLPNLMDGVTLDRTVDIDPNGVIHTVVGGIATSTEWNINDKNNPIVYVSAYAIQTEGHDDIEKAYEAYKNQWNEDGFVEVSTDFVPADEGDLEAIINASKNPVLYGDVTRASLNVKKPAKSVVNLNDKKLNTQITSNGDVKIEKGTLESSTWAFENIKGSAVLNAVTVNAGDASNYALINKDGATTKYENVNVKAAGGGIAVGTGSEVIFTSGSVDIGAASTSGRYNFYVTDVDSKLTIESGTFTLLKSSKRAYIYAGEGTTVYVKGGTFGAPSTRNEYKAGFMGAGNIVVTGGTFGFDPTAWVADGYVAVKSGSIWTVSKI